MLRALGAADLPAGGPGHAAGGFHDPRDAAATGAGRTHPRPGPASAELDRLHDGFRPGLQEPDPRARGPAALARQRPFLMELLQRIGQIIVPVFFIVGVGYWYGRKANPDLTSFNRIILDVLAPVLVYSALAARGFHLQDHLLLLAGGTLLIAGSGLIGWALARVAGAEPRTLVPVVMFNNCGNMGLPLALLAFGPANFGAAVALFSISNLIHFSVGARITSAKARTRDLLLSPLMVATMLGFLSAWSSVRPPEVILSGMKLLGEAMLPMMLLALGVRLTALRRESIALGLLGAFGRPVAGLMVALPLAWGLDLAAGARGQLLLFAALPPAVLQFMLAERYHQEPEKVAAMVLLGNALAVVFIPLALVLAL
ncbi:MAG: AEC family transporter [Burkholderiales bacterium]|nr:MAG: AEC family transporter [Burkholderiales bacterium]